MSEVLAPPVPGETHAARCLNCGAGLRGPFCHACGQPDQPVDLPAREIARGAVGDLFAWDGRFWATVRLLLERPGFLAAEWAAGRRARYIAPLRLYVIASLVFVGVSVVYEGAQDWLHDHPAAEAAEPENRFQGYVPPDRVERADAYMEGMMRLGMRWFFVLMPLGGFGLYVLYNHRRSSYAAHFVLAIHVFVVVILSLAAVRLVRLGWVLVPPHETMSHASPSANHLAMLGAFVACYAYATLAIRRFYGVGAGKALLSAPAVTVGPIAAWFGMLLIGLFLVLAWPT